MVYDWIVYIEDKDKFINLVDRLLTIIKNNPIAIKKGNIKIYTLPHSRYDTTASTQPPFSQINIQISQGRTEKRILITPMKNRYELNSSIFVKVINKETLAIYDVYEDWFNLLKNQSIPIINNGMLYKDNIINEGRFCGLDESRINDEIAKLSEIASLYKINLEQSKYGTHIA